MPQRNRLITGVSSGFGRIMTEQLLARGDRRSKSNNFTSLRRFDAEHRPRVKRQLSSASASRPAAVILTLATSITLPPARTFEGVMVASPWLTKPAIMLAPKPWAASHRCGQRLRAWRAPRRCSALRRGTVIVAGSSSRACH